MNIIQPSILPGMMELLPQEQVVFNKMKEIIESTFKKYAFLPIDTPVMEKLEILLAKGGGETQKQIYTLEKGSNQMGLRFDLTVPLARYVAQHYSDLNFPLRRYHIGKVYRGERNQKGRYREFYQCDIDIIGNDTLSTYNDAEIPLVISEIFKKLGLDIFQFHYNNRKVLNGFFEYLKIDDFVAALRAIDKLQKIGVENVKTELQDIGASEEAVESILSFIDFKGDNSETLAYIKSLGIDNPVFLQGVDELETIYGYMVENGIPQENIKIDLSITRGLDYYTGSVFETFLRGYESIGSVCSGGRYDDLASNYTKQKLPGIGLSIGLTRLFYQLQNANLINFECEKPVTALVIPMKGYEAEALKLLKTLRESDKIVQSYMEGGKLKKQFNYGDKLGVPYVIIIGEEEVNSGLYTMRDMVTGEQNKLSVDEIKHIL